MQAVEVNAGFHGRGAAFLRWFGSREERNHELQALEAFLSCGNTRIRNRRRRGPSLLLSGNRVNGRGKMRRAKTRSLC